jgi:hypothetical protein
MDHGLDYGGQLQSIQELQLDRPAPERQNQQEEDCYHSEGDDNFKVDSKAARVVVVTVWAMQRWGREGPMAEGGAAGQAAWQAVSSQG